MNERERVRMRTSADDAKYRAGAAAAPSVRLHTYRDKGTVIVSVAGVVQ